MTEMSSDSNGRGMAVNTTSNTSTTWTSQAIPRSPFIVGFNEMFNSFIPQGHEKGLRFAFYNTIALIFLGFVLLIMTAVYCILYPFLRPLLWALLCGSALHPFKQKLLVYLQNWIKGLKKESRTITLGTFCLPFSIVNITLDLMIAFFWNYRKLLFYIICVHLISILFFYHSVYPLETLYNCFSHIFIDLILKLSSFVTNPNNTWIIMTSILPYLLTISFAWNDSTKTILTYLSPLVWMTLFIHLISLSGTYGYVITLFIVTVIIIGLIQTSIGAQSHSNSSDQIDGLAHFTLNLKSFIYKISLWLISLLKTKESESDFNDQTDHLSDSTSTDTEKEFASVATSPMPSLVMNVSAYNRRESVNSNIDVKHLSNTYLYTLLWAFLLVLIWLNTKLLYLATIPVILVLLRKGWYYISSFILNNFHIFKTFIQTREEVLLHPFLRYGFNCFLAGDKVIRDAIEVSLNAITSMSVICVTIIVILFAAVFMSIQIYGESLHLVNLMSNVFNKTIGDNQELTQLLPESFQGVHGMLDEVIRNGYEYGREYIKNTIRSAFNVDGNVNKTKVVEKQILEIWDRAYHLWLIRNSNETDSFPKKGPYDFDKLYNALKTLDFSLCFNIVKENIDTVTSVFESVWLLLKGNASLLFSAIAAVFSSLLGGGTALLNLFLNFIIFTTALFYLLSASGESYKPVELVNRLFPSGVASEEKSSFPNSKFGRAVEEAINGVFAASLKISAFYGLYTWLIHTLFDVNIVYIPSVMAAVFGAVPFLGAYWASFPAILELWLVQSETSKAFLMMIFALLPACFIDSSIYSEIQSAGHPYLTGLAIAGGVFFWGVEGPVFGPILLCCLFVAFNMYSSIMEESASTTPVLQPEHTHTPHTSQKRKAPQFNRLQSAHQ